MVLSPLACFDASTRRWFPTNLDFVGAPRDSSPTTPTILPRSKNGDYHLVDRWSPDKGAVHALGIIMLIDLAKLKLLYQEVY